MDNLEVSICLTSMFSKKVLEFKKQTLRILKLTSALFTFLVSLYPLYFHNRFNYSPLVTQENTIFFTEDDQNYLEQHQNIKQHTHDPINHPVKNKKDPINHLSFFHAGNIRTFSPILQSIIFVLFNQILCSNIPLWYRFVDN